MRNKPLFLLLLPLVLLAVIWRGSVTEPIPSLSPGPTVQIIPPARSPAPVEGSESSGPSPPPDAHVIENCVVTYYDVCVLCCGKADGITASGVAAVPYETCAVDPAVIPLGSVVTVAYDDGEIRTYRAEDTGSGVKGNHIDVCVAGHEEARTLGVRRGTVYWEEAEP